MQGERRSNRERGGRGRWKEGEMEGEREGRRARERASDHQGRKNTYSIHVIPRAD